MTIIELPRPVFAEGSKGSWQNVPNGQHLSEALLHSMSVASALEPQASKPALVKLHFDRPLFLKRFLRPFFDLTSILNDLTIVLLHSLTSDVYLDDPSSHPAASLRTTMYGRRVSALAPYPWPIRTNIPLTRHRGRPLGRTTCQYASSGSQATVEKATIAISGTQTIRAHPTTTSRTLATTQTVTSATMPTPTSTITRIEILTTMRTTLSTTTRGTTSGATRTTLSSSTGTLSKQT